MAGRGAGRRLRAGCAVTTCGPRSAPRTWTALGLRLGMLELRADQRGDARSSATSARTCSAPTGTCRPRSPTCGPLATTIGAALLDQRNLAGIGTLWASESLFLARVGPWTPAADVATADVVARLVDPGPPAARRGPAPRGPVQHRDPAPGRGDLRARPVGTPCRRCGTASGWR